jgi:hypothetical protein
MGLNDRQKASRKRAKWLAEFKATLSDDELNYESLKGLGLSDDDIEAVLGEPIIFDAEVVEIHGDSQNESQTPNLPAVIEQPCRDERMEPGNRQQKQYQAKPNRTPDGRSTNKEAVAQYDSTLEKHAERRCTATNAKGERCRKIAIFGSNVCRSHGGATRQVVSSARMRVEMASNRLMGKLIEIAFDDDKPAAVQLEAIKDSLNRAGLKPREQVEVGPIKQYEEIFDEISSGTRVESRRARGIEDDDDSMESIGAENPPVDSMNPVEYEDNSQSTPMSEPLRHKARDSDSDRPVPTERDDNPRRRRQYPPTHITGEDAIRVANQANAQIGALRALPPGRSAG